MDRAAATQKVLDRYRDKPFSWSGANCIRLARAQAVALGHKPPPVPVFRSALGARRALAKLGHRSVSSLMDSLFPRRPAPAFAIMGDLCVLNGEDEDAGLEAVCIADGFGNLFGWHGSDPSRLSTIKRAEADIKAAWMV
jgi:hypothetical protein